MHPHQPHSDPKMYSFTEITHAQNNPWFKVKKELLKEFLAHSFFFGGTIKLSRCTPNLSACSAGGKGYKKGNWPNCSDITHEKSILGFPAGLS